MKVLTSYQANKLGSVFVVISYMICFSESFLIEDGSLEFDQPSEIDISSFKNTINLRGNKNNEFINPSQPCWLQEGGCETPQRQMKLCSSFKIIPNTNRILCVPYDSQTIPNVDNNIARLMENEKKNIDEEEDEAEDENSLSNEISSPTIKKRRDSNSIESLVKVVDDVLRKDKILTDWIIEEQKDLMELPQIKVKARSNSYDDIGEDNESYDGRGETFNNDIISRKDVVIDENLRRKKVPVVNRAWPRKAANEEKRSQPLQKHPFALPDGFTPFSIRLNMAGSSPIWFRRQPAPTTSSTQSLLESSTNIQKLSEFRRRAPTIFTGNVFNQGQSRTIRLHRSGPNGTTSSNGGGWYTQATKVLPDLNGTGAGSGTGQAAPSSGLNNSAYKLTSGSVSDKSTDEESNRLDSFVDRVIFRNIEDSIVSESNIRLTECQRSSFTFKATKSDSAGNKCWGLVSASICQGGCDTGQFSDYVFPHKKSVHKVCTHGKKIRRTAVLSDCNTIPIDNSLREYHYVDAVDCVCKACSRFDTTCLGSVSRPRLPPPPRQDDLEYYSSVSASSTTSNNGLDNGQPVLS